jgi:hypothetical protein
MPNERTCELDYSTFKHNTKDICEENGGQYLESYYKAVCIGDESSIVLGVTYEPCCVPRSCSTEEQSILLQAAADARIKSRLESGSQYECEISQFRMRESEILPKNLVNNNQEPSQEPSSSTTTPPAPELSKTTPPILLADSTDPTPTHAPSTTSGGTRINYWSVGSWVVLSLFAAGLGDQAQ